MGVRSSSGDAMLSATVVALRTAHGWTQSDLARQAGVTSSTINLIEAGHRGASPETLRRLAAALCVTPNDLIGCVQTAVIVQCPHCCGRGVVRQVQA